jgi:hypothetical protein
MLYWMMECAPNLFVILMEYLIAILMSNVHQEKNKYCCDVN